MKPFCLLLIFLVVTFVAVAQQSKPLQLHPQNPHYFLYNNNPIVIVGSGEHYGAVVNTAFDYKVYLSTLKKAGLNTTRLFTGAYIEKLGDFGILKNTLAPEADKILLPWKRTNAAGYVLGGNKFDLNQWNDQYFARLKDFVKESNSSGVIVEVTLFSAHYSGGWNYSPFNPKNNINNTDSVSAKEVNTLHNKNILAHQEKYVRKIVRELNSFNNIYFEIQNEPWADQSDTVFIGNAYGPPEDWRSTLQVVSQRSNEWQKQVAKWVRDEESKLPIKHLISQNIGNFHYPITDADSNISIFNFHYTYPLAVTENYHLNKPIGFNETGFAGKSDHTYRRQAWRFMMAGGALFNHLDYSFSVGSENGQDTTYQAPGGGSPLLRQQLGVLKRYFDKLDLVNLKPDQSLVISSPGAHTQALTNGQSQWIVYLEALAKNSYDITTNLPKGKYVAEWTDVTTGSVIKSEPLTGSILKVPAILNDKVVLIKKQ
jgi:hypothetical protein